MQVISPLTAHPIRRRLIFAATRASVFTSGKLPCYKLRVATGGIKSRHSSTLIPPYFRHIYGQKMGKREQEDGDRKVRTWRFW